MAGERRAFTITMLRQDEEGVWHARVTAGDQSIEVDRKFGSWRAIVRAAPRTRRFVVQNVVPEVAAALQDKVRPIEKPKMPGRAAT